MSRNTERVITATVAIILAVVYYWAARPDKFTETPARPACVEIWTGGTVPQLCGHLPPGELCKRIPASKVQKHALQNYLRR